MSRLPNSSISSGLCTPMPCALTFLIPWNHWIWDNRQQNKHTHKRNDPKVIKISQFHVKNKAKFTQLNLLPTTTQFLELKIKLKIKQNALQTLRPKVKRNKKFKNRFGIRTPNACCKSTLYPFKNWSGYLVRHQNIIHTKWFSIIEIMACEMFRCSCDNDTSKSFSNLMLNSLMMIAESAISSPFNSMNGSCPFLDRSFSLWSTFCKENELKNWCWRIML